jgi:hypothetical protein
MCRLRRSVFHNGRAHLAGTLLALAVFIALPSGGCGNFATGNAEVTSIEPNHGPASGGTQITIVGSSLELPLAVTLNGVAATDLQLINSHALTAIIPPGIPGPATLTIILANGSMITIPNAFTYDEEELSASERPLAITNITPESGPTTGGTALTISGTNFVPGSVLLIDGQPALDLTFVGESLLTATTPPGAEGVAEVTLNTGDGRSTTYPPGFTYVRPDEADTWYPPEPELTLTAVYPEWGPECGQTIVTIQGTGFECGTVVLFDDVLALETMFVNPTILTAVTPPHSPEVVDVTVVLPDGSRATLDDAFEYLTPDSPTIESISPTHGPTMGGTSVTIRGNGFCHGTRVFFGLDAAPSVEILSTQALVALTPPHCEGEVDVTVQNPDCDEDIRYEAFCYVGPEEPVICEIEPECGPACGGTLVTITGRNFRPEVAVLFNDKAASCVTLINSTTLTLITPPNEPGRAEVTVINGDGTRVTERCGFDYLAPIPLEVFSFDPDEGPETGGTVVTILGRGFQPGATVLFGTILALDVDVVSGEIMTAISPPQEGCTVVALTITLPDCQSFTTSEAFEYEAAEPIISSIVPASGPECGGTVVTITGANFEDVENVKFGWTDAEHFAVLSDTMIQAVTPPGCGVVEVRIYGECDEVGHALFEYVPPTTATIGRVCPDSGPEAGGTVVTITGTGLGYTHNVKFDGNPAPLFTVLSDTLVQAVTPPGTGTVIVQVCTPNGTPEALFTYIPPGRPAISTVAPPSGPAGGTVVTICGCNLSCVTEVTFDDHPVCDFVVLCDDCIQVVTPPGCPGRTVLIEVETCNGEAEGLFTYLYPDAPYIACVEPPCGPEEGWTRVLINGYGFAETFDVTFGSEPAYFSVLSDRQIIACSPPGEGTVPLVVVTPFGAAAALFTYIPEETASIASLTPASGPEAGGTLVTIIGTQLGETTNVTFDGISAPLFTILSDTMIEAVTPPGVGIVVVVVETEYGNPEALFMYVPPGTPSIGSLTPPTGPEAGGTIVTITGTGFADATNVKFGGVAAPHFAVLSDTLIEAETPPGTGTVDVKVATPNGNVHALFTYIPPATLSIGKVHPPRGPEAGGTIVTIRGTDLLSVTAVTFGGTPATSFAALSDEELQAVAPPGSGTVQIAITNGPQTAFAYFTYIPPTMLAICYIDPDHGWFLCDTIITVVGTALTGVTEVTIDGTPADYVVLSDDVLQVIAPPDGIGTVVLSITNGTQAAAAYFTYTLLP